jgi:acetoin utilization deacetylase AcuC-like enzyme
LVREFSPLHLVISAGMDIYAADPLGRIKVSTEGIAEIGRHIAALDVPAALVMEGGYNNAALGRNMLGFLEGFR